MHRYKLISLFIVAILLTSCGKKVASVGKENLVGVTPAQPGEVLTVQTESDGVQVPEGFPKNFYDHQTYSYRYQMTYSYSMSGNEMPMNGDITQKASRVVSDGTHLEIHDMAADNAMSGSTSFYADKTDPVTYPTDITGDSFLSDPMFFMPNNEDSIDINGTTYNISYSLAATGEPVITLTGQLTEPHNYLDYMDISAIECKFTYIAYDEPIENIGSLMNYMHSNEEPEMEIPDLTPDEMDKAVEVKEADIDPKEGILLKSGNIYKVPMKTNRFALKDPEKTSDYAIYTYYDDGTSKMSWTAPKDPENEPALTEFSETTVAGEEVWYIQPIAGDWYYYIVNNETESESDEEEEEEPQMHTSEE